MMAATDCIFCRIIAGTIPCQKVYEDEHSLAFRDIQPAAPQHLLVVPKVHVMSLEALDQAPLELPGHLLRAVRAAAQAAGFAADGYRTVINTGVGAGQIVMHLHMHVLAGRNFDWPPG